MEPTLSVFWRSSAGVEPAAVISCFEEMYQTSKMKFKLSLWVQSVGQHRL